MKTVKKLIKNTGICLIAGLVICGLAIILHPQAGVIWAIKVGIGMTLFFSMLLSFFGDEKFNITGNWSEEAKEFKEVLGGFLNIMWILGEIILLMVLIGLLFT